MPTKPLEPRSRYYSHNPNKKFWYYKSDPGVKHNNHQCRTCIYRSNESDGSDPLTRVYCEYILVEKHMRGCHPAPNCERYVKGKRINRRNEFNPHGSAGFKSPEEPDYLELGDGYST